jgi:aminopeptidase YwaD
MRKLFVFCSLFFTLAAPAQKKGKEDRVLVENLKRHIGFLAADSLGGRRTGTRGEASAARYIYDAFKGMGLEPKGTIQYLQPFDVDEGKQIAAATHLSVEGKLLQLGKEFFPLAFSGNGAVQALPSLSLQEAEMPWFVDLKETLESARNNPHYDVEAYIRNKAKSVKEKGGTALLVYNSATVPDGVSFKATDRSETAPIPVLYITKEGMNKYFNDPSATLDISLKTELSPKIRTGTNVVGFINNKAATTVVLGAHFDHLGFGEDGNSLQPASSQVHNGADDNASGTAALLELARVLKTSGPRNQNFLFIAFSGEELGLFGSKYFTEHPTIDLASVAYMINMDMVGRLSAQSGTLTVGGYGTSPAWGTAFGAAGKRGLYKESLQYRFDSSGTGPSDHTSFYRKAVPVLFYFTGLHTDYHKPSDDADKINYEGLGHIVKHIQSLVSLQSKTPGKPVFTPTKEVQMGAAAAFKVTLGIMPDYSFGGKGVRVDGIIDNRPAQKAGMKAGDVIVQLGDIEITSMEKYMEALGQFNKGQKTNVVYQRGAEKQNAQVEF